MAEAILKLAFPDGRVSLIVPEAYAGLQLPALTEFVFDTWQRGRPWTLATYRDHVAEFNATILPGPDQIATRWVAELDHYYTMQFGARGALDLRWENRTGDESQWKRATSRFGLTRLAISQLEGIADLNEAFGDWRNRRRGVLAAIGAVFEPGPAERTAALVELHTPLPERTDRELERRVAAVHSGDRLPIALDLPPRLGTDGGHGASTSARALEFTLIAHLAPGTDSLLATDIAQGEHFRPEPGEHWDWNWDTATGNARVDRPDLADIVGDMEQDHQGDLIVLTHPDAVGDLALEAVATPDRHGYMEHNPATGSRYYQWSGALGPDCPTPRAAVAARIDERIDQLERDGWRRLDLAGTRLPITASERRGVFIAAATADLLAAALALQPREAVAETVRALTGQHRGRSRLDALVWHWTIAWAGQQLEIDQAGSVRRDLEHRLAGTAPSFARQYYRRNATGPASEAMHAAATHVAAARHTSEDVLSDLDQALADRVIDLVRLAGGQPRALLDQYLLDRDDRRRPPAAGPRVPLPQIPALTHTAEQWLTSYSDTVQPPHQTAERPAFTAPTRPASPRTGPAAADSASRHR